MAAFAFLDALSLDFLRAIVIQIFEGMMEVISSTGV